MKLSVIEKMKENLDQIKKEDLTISQLIGIQFILTDDNWKLNKSEISKQTGFSRVTIHKCFKLIDKIYNKIENENN